VALAPLLLSLPLLDAAQRASATGCGNGVEVRLSAADPAQGEVVLVEVAPPPPSGGVTADWKGRPLAFWPDGDRLLALLGVDLQSDVGPTPLVIRAPGAPCAAPLEVRAGEFEERRLEVPRRYVELSPADRARAEREAARLEALFATETKERLWERLRLPLNGVEPTDNFGQRRILNGEPRSPHAGVDFSARPGTPVRATGRGRVALAGSLFFSGRTVVLDHGLGLFSFYGHLSAIAVRPGAVVEAGALLGRVGATGRATGPHLHWSVRLRGARVNPLSLLALFSDGPAGD
jgi:murein DD-endopeptidase MepM/ murein hydrolase activator NlpD